MLESKFRNTTKGVMGSQSHYDFGEHLRWLQGTQKKRRERNMSTEQFIRFFVWLIFFRADFKLIGIVWPGLFSSTLNCQKYEKAKFWGGPRHSALQVPWLGCCFKISWLKASQLLSHCKGSRWTSNLVNCSLEQGRWNYLKIIHPGNKLAHHSAHESLLTRLPETSPFCKSSSTQC